MKKYIVILLSALSLLFSSCKEEAVDVLGVTIDKQSQNLTIGDSFVLKAIVSPSNATNQAVIWTTSNSSVVDLRDNGDGTATVKGLETGTAQVIVKTDDGALTDKCTVNVGAFVESIQLSKTSVELKVGETSQLEAQVKPLNASNLNVLWTSDSPSIATVDDKGKITAVAPGEATIIASTSDGGFTSSCKVTVICPVTGITLNETTKDDLYLGEAFTLEATIFPAEATNKNVKWQSSDEKVAKVASDGTVTALNPGTVTITVTAEDGGYQAKCTVNVKCFANHIDINHETLDLVEGQTAQLIATVYPEQATDKTLAWASDKPEIATVGTDGKVTAVKAGTATITVTTGQGVSKKCTVTVTSPVSGITIDASTISLMPGATHQLTATILPDNASNKEMTWSSDNDAVATVSQTGLVTAVKSGSTCIHVTTADGGKTAKCLVEVLIPTQGVSLDVTSCTLYTGESKKLNATVTPSNATYKNVTWSVSDEAVAKVDQNGNITAVKAGSATVTATTENGGFKATCNVTVKQHVTAVSLDQTSLELYVNETETLTATVLPEDATNKSVTWSTSDQTVATVSNGTITAKKVGTATITVKTADMSKTATCKVTVKAHVSSVAFNKTTMTLNVGESETLTATVSPSDASDKTLTWTSSDESVAKVDANGKVSALKVGTATIKAVSTDGAKEATCTVTVAQHVSSVSLDQTSLNMYVGDTKTLVATVLPAAAANKKVTWKSSDATIVTVDANGKLTAKKAGNAKITVTTEDQGKTATCMVFVKQHAESVSLDKTALTLGIDEKYTLTATVLPANANDKSVTWSSDNQDVAFVNPSTGSVMGVSVGTANVTVKTTDGGYTATCKVTVVTASIKATALTLTPTTLKLQEGETSSLKLTITPADATEVIKWSSDNESVVTVTNGDIKAVSIGTATITVQTEDGRLKKTCAVTVTEKIDVTGVTLDKTEVAIKTDETATLTATVAPADAKNKSVNWTSNNSSVATVDSNGKITPVSAGTAVITATTVVGGFKATCTVTVTEVIIPIQRIDYAEKNSTITLYEGEYKHIMVNVTPTNANEALQVKPATNCPVRADYQRSSTAGVWDVKITALYKTGTGKVWIDSDDFSTQFTVTVLNMPVSGVSLNRSELAMKVGETATLEATILPENASNKNVKWESGNTSILYVSQAGVLTAKGAGKTYVTVTTSDGSKVAKCEVLVRDNNVSAGGAEGVGFDEWN